MVGPNGFIVLQRVFGSKSGPSGKILLTRPVLRTFFAAESQGHQPQP